MASTITEADQSETLARATQAGIASERVGSDRYQQSHMAMIFQQGFSFSGFERNKVFIADGRGKWVDLSDVSGADSEGDCRAAVVADFDDDGDPDVFCNAIQRESHMLFRNDTTDPSAARFVKVRLLATEGRDSGVGAIVKLASGGRVQARVLSCGTGFESQDAPELIFGTGGVREGRLSVRWPGRKVEDFGAVAAGGRYVLEEGTGRAKTTSARTFAFADPGGPGLLVQAGQPLPPVAVLELDGGATRLPDGDGRPLLINFWATTCRSCVAELPLLQRLHTAGKFRVVGVTLDPATRIDQVQRVAAKVGATFPMLRMADAEVARLFDVSRLAIPITLIVSPTGKIERIIQGILHEDDLGS